MQPFFFEWALPFRAKIRLLVFGSSNRIGDTFYLETRRTVFVALTIGIHLFHRRDQAIDMC